MNAPLTIFTHKTCSRCERSLPFAEFSARGRSRDGLQPWCKSCFSVQRRETKYGLTAEEINAMLTEGCAVCGSRAELCIDHDHVSGQTRGVLCDWHNRALGLLHDDAEEVANHLAYRLAYS